MKTIKLTTLIFYLVLASYSCKDKIQDTYMVNEPLYLSYADLRSSFQVKSADEIVQPGKIYYNRSYQAVRSRLHFLPETNCVDRHNLSIRVH